MERGFYIGEITLKTRVIAFLILCSAFTLAQGVRFGDGQPIWQSTDNLNHLAGVSGATIAFCTAPANAVPCTNKATTYTDSTLSSPCSTSTQVVLAGSSTCQATGDSIGNWGVWAASGQYQYTVTIAGVSYGPYSATLGTVSGGNAAFKCQNTVCFADQFPGLDASVKVNNCIAYVIAAGGGVCDARGLAGNQSNLSQLIGVGQHNPPAGLWVTLMVPDHGDWTWAAVSNASACLVTQYDHSSIIGTPSGEGIQFQFKASGSDSSLANVFCLDTNPTSGGNYVRTEGFAVNANGATISRAVLEWAKTFDHAVLRSVRASGSAANAPVKTLWVWGTCCGTSVYNASGEGNGVNIPFYIGNPTVFGTSGTAFTSITGVNPPSGQSAVVLDTGSTWTEYNTFQNVYTENHSADTTTAMIKIKASCCGPANGPNYFMGVRSGSDTGGATRYALDIDSGGKALLMGTNTGVSSNAINDHNTNGGTISPGANGNVSFYSTEPIYSTGLFASLGGTVANLPSAASNAGRMMYVTDSTAIASEGQTCAGGGSIKALAFSNGTNWKCF
jgi:hypothetical protein